MVLFPEMTLLSLSRSEFEMRGGRDGSVEWRDCVWMSRRGVHTCSGELAKPTPSSLVSNIDQSNAASLR